MMSSSFIIVATEKVSSLLKQVDRLVGDGATLSFACVKFMVPEAKVEFFQPFLWVLLTELF
jgi:hypothetical protein